MSAFVIRCTHAATGTLLEPLPSLPAIPITGIQFILGSRSPVALQDRYPYEYYFKDHVYEIAPGHPTTFQVTGNPQPGAYEWKIDIAVLVGNGTESFLVGDSGHPFLTTDSLPKGSNYKGIYQECQGGERCVHGWSRQDG